MLVNRSHPRDLADLGRLTTKWRHRALHGFRNKRTNVTTERRATLDRFSFNGLEAPSAQDTRRVRLEPTVVGRPLGAQI